MNHTKIIEYKEGDKYEDIYLLKSCSLKETKTGKTYLDAELSDASGTLSVKLWNVTSKDDNLVVGGFVKAKISISSFNDQLQGTIDTIEPVSIDEIAIEDLNDLIPTAPIKADVMYDYLLETARGFKNDDLRKVVEKILEEEKEGLFHTAGAKKVHHAVVNGLLLHTSYMLKSAKAICEVYNPGYFGIERFSLYPSLDVELVMAGVILHDIGKIEEFDTNEFGLVNEYSTEGSLMGHLFIGAYKVKQACAELGIGKELTNNLVHIILSHHGKPEFGAVAVPQTIEAKLVNYVDEMDAHLNVYAGAVEGLEEGTFSERNFAAGTRIYKHGDLKNKD